MGGLTRGFLLFASVLVLSTNLQAAEKTKQTSGTEGQKSRVEQVDMSACEHILSGEVLKRYDLMAKDWSLLDLLNPNAAVNLAVQFPTVLMNSDQMNYFVATYHGQELIREPAYRSKMVPYYPMISRGGKETKGRMIVGHFESIAGGVEYLRARATGQRTSKMVGFIGPAGTGKTEMLMLLNSAADYLAMNDPKFYQLTFDFTGLDEIPELRPLARASAGAGGSSADLTLNASPLVLLPDTLQKRVVEMGRQQFVDKFGIQPIPFLTPTTKTQRVVDAIIRHYKKLEGKTDITDADYMRYLTAHVRVVRRQFETKQPAAIVRFREKNTDLAPLFMVENLALSQYYGATDPLSFNYGVIPRMAGRGVALDEFFRQSGPFRDMLLDTTQNGVIGYGAAPEEFLNATLMFATNDASIEEAQKNGGAAAHLDRTRRLPMRHALEPWHVVKIALADIGPSQFVMRELETPKTELTPVAELPQLDLQAVLPDLEDGRPVGTDGRYALYFYPDREKPPVLIAPRTLMMLGLTASGTRMVRDRAVIDKINQSGHRLHTFDQYPEVFIDPTERMRILLGTVQPAAPVAHELYRFRNVAREGENGLGAREVEEWFSTALNESARLGTPLTPLILGKVFDQKMDSGFSVTPKQKPAWHEIATLVRSDFLLSAISSDVVGILQGQGRPEALYDDVKKELLARRTNKKADRIYGEGNIGVPIDQQRMTAIFKIYRELNGADFDPGLLIDFHLQVSEQATVKRHPQLLEAIRRFIMRSEMDKTTISDLLDFYNGRPVSDEVRVRGTQAESQFERYGYDKKSFIQALVFVRDSEFYIRDQNNK